MWAAMGAHRFVGWSDECSRLLQGAGCQCDTTPMRIDSSLAGSTQLQLRVIVAAVSIGSLRS